MGVRVIGLIAAIGIVGCCQRPDGHRELVDAAHRFELACTDRRFVPGVGLDRFSIELEALGLRIQHAGSVGACAGELCARVRGRHVRGRADMEGGLRREPRPRTARTPEPRENERQHERAERTARQRQRSVRPSVLDPRQSGLRGTGKPRRERPRRTAVRLDQRRLARRAPRGLGRASGPMEGASDAPA